MNKMNWLAVTAFSVVVLLSIVAVSLLGGWGMMGNWGNRGWGMMDGWGFGPFGWNGMIVMSLVVLGFIVLTAIGLVWLARVRIGDSKPQ